MTSWIINYVIDKYLNHIIEVDSSVTSASMFQDGKIEFGKVKIKQDFLKTLNMPFFDFQETFIGKFSAKIYYSLLSMDYHFENHPIYIELDEVYILVKQKGMSDWSEEQKIKEMENFKKFTLQEYEDAYKQYLMNMAEKTEDDFMKKIIHNLNISISNIVLRFEDEISNPGSPYALGLFIQEIKVKPTKEDFDINETEEIPFKDVNHKLVKLEGLSVFMDIYNSKENDINSFKNYLMEDFVNKNEQKKSYLKNSFDYYCYCRGELEQNSSNETSHNFLIYNLDLTLKLSMNSNFKKNYLPETYVDLLINSIDLKINLFQIKSIMKLLNVTKTYSIAQAGMESLYYTKKLSAEDENIYTGIYVKYFEERYFKNSKETEWNNYVVKMNEIETKVKFNEIQAMRNAAGIKLEHLKKINDYDDKIAKIKPGYFSYFTSQATYDEIDKLEEDKKKLISSEDVVNKLMEEEMKKKDIPVIDPYEGMDKSYVRMDVKLQLKKFRFELKEEKTVEMIDINFREFETHMLQGIDSMQVYLFLGDFYINQYKLKDTVFTKIIESHNDEDETLVSFGKQKDGNLYEKYYEEKKGALSISFIMSPDQGPSMYSLRMRSSKRLYIYSNLYSLKFIGYLVGDSVKNEVNFDEISKYTTEEGYKYIESGYAQVNNILTGEYQHFNIDLDIMILGPRVIVPQNIIDKNNKKCLMLSFGEFGMFSNLAPKKSEDVNYKKITDDKRLYDYYEIKASGFELVTIDNFEGVEVMKDTKKLSIFEKVEFEMKIKQIIEPKNERRENFALEMQFKSLDLKIRDVQIEFLLYSLKYFGLVNAKCDKELAELQKANEKEEKSEEKNTEELHEDAINKHNESILDQSAIDEEGAKKGKIKIIIFLFNFSINIFF